MLEAWTGLRKGVVSNFWISGFPQYLCRQHGISGYFEFVMDSSQVGWRKPNPEIYRCAMSQAGVTESLFVGDNIELDVAGPRLLGMRSVHYQGDWTSFRVTTV
jgi:putative hydrolase of the HAD superfamily